MAKRAKRDGPGGFRGTQGRKSLFPNKGVLSKATRPSGNGPGVKATIYITRVAYDAAVAEAARLTTHKPKIPAAEKVNVVTFSDAVEYLIRRGIGTPLED